MLNKESNINDKINLKKNIKFLNNKEDYLVILQFLIDNKIKYTENSNGIFFNLKLLSNDMIIDLIDIVNKLTNNKNKQLTIPIIENNITNNTDNYVDNLHLNYKKYITNDEDE